MTQNYETRHKDVQKTVLNPLDVFLDIFTTSFELLCCPRGYSCCLQHYRNSREIRAPGVVLSEKTNFFQLTSLSTIADELRACPGAAPAVRRYARRRARIIRNLLPNEYGQHSVECRTLFSAFLASSCSAESSLLRVCDECNEAFPMIIDRPAVQ